MSAPTTTLYFVQAGNGGPIKIGVATDLSKRLAALQTGSPAELRLLGTMTGDMADERALHVRFRDHRLRGEWFSPADDLLAFIREATNAAPAPAPRPLIERIAFDAASVTVADMDAAVLIPGGRRTTWGNVTPSDIEALCTARYDSYRRGARASMESFRIAVARIRETVFEYGTVGAAFEAGGFPPKTAEAGAA